MKRRSFLKACVAALSLPVIASIPVRIYAQSAKVVNKVLRKNVVLYVNTSSTAGGYGTTADVSGPDRAFSSMSELEASTDCDLIASNKSVKIMCKNGNSGNIKLTGWKL